MDITNKSNIKRLEVGKFYFIHDGSKTGHPGYLVWKDDEANRYLFVRFDSDKFDVEKTKKQRGVKHITKLKHPTSDKVMNSYVHNRPMICRKKDIGTELRYLHISSEDVEIIKNISIGKPEFAPSFRK